MTYDSPYAALKGEGWDLWPDPSLHPENLDAVMVFINYRTETDDWWFGTRRLPDVHWPDGRVTQARPFPANQISAIGAGTAPGFLVPNDMWFQDESLVVKPPSKRARAFGLLKRAVA